MKKYMLTNSICAHLLQHVVDKSKLFLVILFAIHGLLTSVRLILKRICDKNDLH